MGRDGARGNRGRDQAAPLFRLSRSGSFGRAGDEIAAKAQTCAAPSIDAKSKGPAFQRREGWATLKILTHSPGRCGRLGYPRSQCPDVPNVKQATASIAADQ